MNQKPASVARVCDIHSSNDHRTSVCPCSQQSGVDDPPEIYAANTYSRPPQQRDKALDIEDGSQLLATSAKTRKLEGKRDALVNLVTQLAPNQKPASIARVYGIRSTNDHHTSVRPSLQQYGVDEHPEAYAANAYSRPLQNRDKALDREDGSQLLAYQYTSTETRKLEGKLDALVNLVTHIAANQKPAFVARVCVFRSSNDQHTSVCASSQKSEVDENPEPYSTKTYGGPPQQQRHGVHEVAIETSAETRKLERKIDALVNLVTQLAANKKPASVARVCGIRSSNDHHTSVCPSS
ncbi:hypothetical protein Fmac_028524 [Flemingia macrophylla]|uniref:Uncharacterized protein n=1 Tax=Flemingia macrophylla TaxID=520843 RepID=A0ABD1L7R4_9FABA